MKKLFTMKTKTKKTSRKMKLGEIARDIREPYEPIKTEGKPYIGLEHIEQQTLQLSGVGRSSETQSTKKVFKSGDILFGTLRPYFRKVVRPKFDGVCSTDIAVIRPTQKGDGDFLKYFIANQDFIDFASNNSSGTRTPRANWKTLQKTEWTLPELGEQNKIGDVLSAYDDLIENNTKRIKILEQIAQAIYKEGFVYFRFPGHEKVKMVDSKTEIGKGWGVIKAGQLLAKVQRKPKVKRGEYIKEGEFLVVDQGQNFISGYTADAEAVYRENLPLIVFGDHTRILKFIDFPFACGADGTQLLSSNSKRMPITLFFYALQNVDLSNFAYARHFKFLKEKNVLFPDQQTASAFDSYINPIRGFIRGLLQENIKLRQARDLLLPKLVTGEIEVKL